MKKINFECVLKISIFISIFIFYYLLLKTDAINVYVHPRIIPYIRISLMGIIIIVLSLIIDIFKRNTIKRSMKNYSIFIIPLLIILILLPKEIKKSNNLNDEVNKVESEKLIVDESNFLEVVDNIDKLIGEDIIITGFIYREKETEKGSFFIGRHLMTCCTADLHSIGLVCHYEENDVFKESSWVKIAGRIKENHINKIVFIDVQNMEEINPPKNQYVYLE